MEIVKSILDNSNKFRLIYKPHPFTGSMITRWAALNDQIKALVKNHPGGHFVDDSPFGWQPKVADLMITDVSAVAYDWLATGKPIILTRPTEPRAELNEGGIFGSLKLLEAGSANQANKWVTMALEDPDVVNSMKYWSARYYEPAIKQGKELFIKETLRLISENKKVWPELKNLSVRSAGALGRIKKFLPLDLKLRVNSALENSLNGKIIRGHAIFAYMSESRFSSEFLSELCNSEVGKSTMLVKSPRSMFLFLRAAIFNKRFRDTFKLHLVSTAQSVASAVAEAEPVKLFT